MYFMVIGVLQSVQCVGSSPSKGRLCVTLASWPIVHLVTQPSQVEDFSSSVRFTNTPPERSTR